MRRAATQLLTEPTTRQFSHPLSRGRYVCAQCRRTLASTALRESGHNKWSKIKHTKGAEDKKRSNRNSQFTHTLTVYSKMYGSNLEFNSQLAAAVASAKKAGVPKTVIEAAIARGQGRSLSGASLESLTLDAMVSPSVALLIEVETDNKIRAMQEVRVALNKYSAAFSSTKFFFTRRGRVVFERTPETGSDEILDVAVEAGAEDVEEDEEGNVLVWTGPSGTARVCAAVEGAFGLKIMSSEIVWAPNEESSVILNEVGDVQRVADLVAALRDVPDVQAVYCNASKGAVADEEWSKLESNVDT